MSKPLIQNINSAEESLGAMIFAAPNYRDFLKSVLQILKSKNPQYSLRAFALKLDLPAGFLSQVLSGSRNLGRAKAMKLAQILKLTPEETDIFLKMIEWETTEDATFKERLQQQVLAMQAKVRRTELDLQRFQVLSEWYAIPLMEMMSSPFYQENSEQAALDLGVPASQIELCLEKLSSLNLLQKEVRTTDQKIIFRKPSTNLLISSPMDQLAIKRFNAHMLEKMKRALYDQSPGERYSSSETMLIDPSQLPQANAIINKCLDELHLLFSKGEKRTHIYHAGIHLISLRKKTLKLSTGDES